MVLARLYGKASTIEEYVLAATAHVPLTQAALRAVLAQPGDPPDYEQLLRRSYACVVGQPAALPATLTLHQGSGQAEVRTQQ